MRLFGTCYLMGSSGLVLGGHYAIPGERYGLSASMKVIAFRGNGITLVGVVFLR